MQRCEQQQRGQESASAQSELGLAAASEQRAAPEPDTRPCREDEGEDEDEGADADADEAVSCLAARREDQGAAGPWAAGAASSLHVDAETTAPLQHAAVSATAKEVEQVHGLIERCMQQYLSKMQVMYALQHKANVDPALTSLVWDQLEARNPAFFALYQVRAKLKDQINVFNHLLEEQASMVQQLDASPSQEGGDFAPGAPQPRQPRPVTDLAAQQLVQQQLQQLLQQQLLQQQQAVDDAMAAAASEAALQGSDTLMPAKLDPAASPASAQHATVQQKRQKDSDGEEEREGGEEEEEEEEGEGVSLDPALLKAWVAPVVPHPPHQPPAFLASHFPATPPPTPSYAAGARQEWTWPNVHTSMSTHSDSLAENLAEGDEHSMTRASDQPQSASYPHITLEDLKALYSPYQSAPQSPSPRKANRKYHDQSPSPRKTRASPFRHESRGSASPEEALERVDESSG